MWSLAGNDWKAKSSEFIVEKIAPGVGQGRSAEIVLLHDGSHLGFGADRSHTVEATQLLLEHFKNQCFVGISSLTLKAGT